MTRYEQLETRLMHAVAVDDVAAKTQALEESAAPGFFDGLDDLEVIRLKTIRSDIWRTRLEVCNEQAVSS